MKKRFKRTLIFSVAVVVVILLVFAAAEICKSNVPVWAKIVTLCAETYMYAHMCKQARIFEQKDDDNDDD